MVKYTLQKVLSHPGQGQRSYSNLLILWIVRKYYQLKNIGLHSGPRPTVVRQEMSPSMSPYSFCFKIEHWLPSGILCYHELEFLKSDLMGKIHTHTDMYKYTHADTDRYPSGIPKTSFRGSYIDAEWIIKSRCLTKLVIFTNLKCAIQITILKIVFFIKM